MYSILACQRGNKVLMCCMHENTGANRWECPKKGIMGEYLERDSPKRSYHPHDSLVLEQSRCVLRFSRQTQMKILPAGATCRRVHKTPPSSQDAIVVAGTPSSSQGRHRRHTQPHCETPLSQDAHCHRGTPQDVAGRRRTSQDVEDADVAGRRPGKGQLKHTLALRGCLSLPV